MRILHVLFTVATPLKCPCSISLPLLDRKQLLRYAASVVRPRGCHPARALHAQTVWSWTEWCNKNKCRKPEHGRNITGNSAKYRNATAGHAPDNNRSLSGRSVNVATVYAVCVWPCLANTMMPRPVVRCVYGEVSPALRYSFFGQPTVRNGGGVGYSYRSVYIYTETLASKIRAKPAER